MLLLCESKLMQQNYIKRVDFYRNCDFVANFVFVITLFIVYFLFKKGNLQFVEFQLRLF